MSVLAMAMCTISAVAQTLRCVWFVPVCCLALKLDRNFVKTYKKHAKSSGAKQMRLSAQLSQPLYVKARNSVLAGGTVPAWQVRGNQRTEFWDDRAVRADH